MRSERQPFVDGLFFATVATVTFEKVHWSVGGDLALSDVLTFLFLAAFALPVTFESVMWVTGSGSLASVASFTPGAVGVTQATNALALKTCCDVANDVAIDYSTAQQLITTGWNQVVALVLVLWVFGWAGGKQLVGQSYLDAKAKTAETKAEHKRKTQAKKDAKRGAGRG